MVNTRGIARLGMLAVGLGIGAAVAHTPVAAADTTTDPFSWLSGLDFSSAAAAPAGLDFQINIDGVNLFPTLNNGATAESGLGDIAIASGNGSFACAGCTDSPGTFDFASASGAGSAADSGFGNLDDAFASGTNSLADAGAGNVDTAIANGANSFANATGVNPDALGNFNFADAFGANTNAEAGSILTDTPSSYDIASVFDPSSTVGSTALAGDGNFDLGAVFGDSLASTDAVGGNYLVDILPGLDLAAPAAATEGGSFLTELLSLF